MFSYVCYKNINRYMQKIASILFRLKLNKEFYFEKYLYKQN